MSAGERAKALGISRRTWYRLRAESDWPGDDAPVEALRAYVSARSSLQPATRARVGAVAAAADMLASGAARSEEAQKLRLRKLERECQRLETQIDREKGRIVSEALEEVVGEFERAAVALRRAFEGLGLTPEQVDAVNTALAEFEADVSAVRPGDQEAPE